MRQGWCQTPNELIKTGQGGAREVGAIIQTINPPFYKDIIQFGLRSHNGESDGQENGL